MIYKDRVYIRWKISPKNISITQIMPEPTSSMYGFD